MKFKGMPIGSPLVLHGPFIFEHADFHLLVCKAEPEYMKSILPEGLQVFPFKDIIILALVDYPTVYPEYDPALKYKYNESCIFIPVRKKGTLFDFGLYAAYTYASNDRAVAAGREIYGFPKKQGETKIKTEGKTISVILTRLNKNIININGTRLKRRILSFFVNIFARLLPSQLLTLIFPKIYNYKYIPRVDGPGPQISEVTRTKFKIDKIRQVEWLKREKISIQLTGAKADPLHMFSSQPLMKPLLAFHQILDFTLPHGRVSR